MVVGEIGSLHSRIAQCVGLEDGHEGTAGMSQKKRSRLRVADEIGRIGLFCVRVLSDGINS